MTSDYMRDLEARVAALEATVREMKALTKGDRGDAGRDGKDGRDGRDGKSVSPKLINAIVKSVTQPQRPAIYVEPQIVVQASDVILEASIPPSHVDTVENHVHVDGMERLAQATEALRDTMEKPMRPVYDPKGKLIGGERVDSL